MRNKLKKYIEIIKTGDSKQVKIAQKKIENFYHDAKHPLSEDLRNEFEIFIDELNNYDLIENNDNKAYFINTLKWSYMAIGDKYFDLFSYFTTYAIQNKSGKIRQAILRSVDWLLISNIFDLGDHSKDPSLEQQRTKDKTRDVFCEFAYRTELLIDKYEEPRFNRYTYIKNLPSGIYKSLQYLLYCNLLRSPKYEKIYQDWLNDTNKIYKNGKQEKR